MSRAIVVVPCYNEAKRLNMRAIQDFGRRTDTAELLFVNDGSRDETLELLEHLNAANPRRFSFLHLVKNSGKAEAVRQGLLLAIRSGADYVGYWDADLATPLSDIEPFCRVLDNQPHVHAVLGSRMPLLGRHIERQALRRALGRVFARVASLALGLRIFDTQCGAKLFRVTPEMVAVFERPFLTNWIFDVEILARMKRCRCAAGRPALEQVLYEYPLDRWRDVAGSTVKSSDFGKAVFEMARIYWTYLRPGAPAFAVQPDAEGRVLSPAPPRGPRSDQRAA
ncbi:MAG: glycosyltransferase [Planctomycetota bacterium]|nr:MAG: glycosyltransferase [Planctomycetota bacterium]